MGKCLTMRVVTFEGFASGLPIVPLAVDAPLFVFLGYDVWQFDFRVK